LNASPDKADQTFRFALVIALSRSPKAIFKQVMALYLREHLRAQSLSALHDLGYRQFEGDRKVHKKQRHTAHRIFEWLRDEEIFVPLEPSSRPGPPIF
jgi:hypothetical protein